MFVSVIGVIASVYMQHFSYLKVDSVTDASAVGA